MRIAMLALPSNAGHEEENLAGLDVALTGAGPCDVAVVAEAFGQGFEAITDDPLHDIGIGWDQDGPELGRLRDIARRHHTAICCGFIERDGGTLHSSAVVVDRDGRTVALYRRMSAGWRAPDADTSVYVDGTEPVCFTLDGHRMTVALCGDLWELPERFAALRVDVVLWPVFVNYPPERWAQEIVPYAEQAGLVCDQVLLVNSLADRRPSSPEWAGQAHGGAAWFQGGTVQASLPMGCAGELVVTLP